LRFKGAGNRLLGQVFGSFGIVRQRPGESNQSDTQ